jgi:hypothetical protein
MYYCTYKGLDLGTGSLDIGEIIPDTISKNLLNILVGQRKVMHKTDFDAVCKEHEAKFGEKLVPDKKTSANKPR